MGCAGAHFKAIIAPPSGCLRAWLTAPSGAPIRPPCSRCEKNFSTPSRRAVCVRKSKIEIAAAAARETLNFMGNANCRADHLSLRCSIPRNLSQLQYFKFDTKARAKCRTCDKVRACKPYALTVTLNGSAFSPWSSWRVLALACCSRSRNRSQRPPKRLRLRPNCSSLLSRRQFRPIDRTDVQSADGNLSVARKPPRSDRANDSAPP